MRELKFRAWDTKKNKMWDMEELGYFMFDNITEAETKFNSILMQFTGLKDKNDKEVYEGDILLNKCYGERQIIVKWVTDGFNASSHSMGGIKQCEVIGNIYENPELIQDSTKGGMKVK